MHTLYSFRFCPYATRARMLMALCGISFELREINLQRKPAPFLETSPKGTVPVLVADNGLVVEESLEVMLWALKQKDIFGFFALDDDKRTEQLDFIKTNDTTFARDSYFLRNPHKVPYEDLPDPEVNVEEVFTPKCRNHIDMLETRLQKNTFLFGSEPSLADVAVFPFVWILQNHVEWIAPESFPKTCAWLDHFVFSQTFADIMVKSQPWLGGEQQGVVVEASAA